MICITFDNFGCGAAFGFGQGKMPPQMRPEMIPVSEWECWNELSLSLGQPRILGLLKELGIRTTFFAEGYAAVLHPAELKKWVDQGHEIALHAWKHEIWTKVPSKEAEGRLISLGMQAMTEALGSDAPVGFRPPGLKINPWTEEILKDHGIRYISQVGEGTRDQSFSDKFDKLGIDYADAGMDVKISSLKLLPCSDELTDAFLVAPEFGGLFGKGDVIAAFDHAFDLAVRHENATPDKPWVFIAHPMVSGNRAWIGFDRFLRKLRDHLPATSFKTARDVLVLNS